MSEPTTPGISEQPDAANNSFRFRLIDLFAMVALCAVFAWCASIIGSREPRFWAAVASSLVVVAVFVVGCRSQRKAWLIPLALFPLFSCLNFPGFSSVPTLLSSLLLLVGAIALSSRPPQSVRRLLFAAAATTAACFVLGVAFGYLRVGGILALREEFPIVSLADRLNYEQQSSLAGQGAQLTSPAKNELNKFESELDEEMYGNRDYELRQLHGERVEWFFRTSGFGVGRMAYPRGEHLGTPALLDIPFSGSEELFNHNRGYAASWRYFGPTLTESPMDRLHRFSRMDFLYPDGYGAVISADDKSVAGFVEHGFHWAPLQVLDLAKEWELLRLELVSLLKFDEPRVYVLDHLPRMDQLSSENVPTRELDEFETASLEKLWTQEDLVIRDDGAETIRMLGSLRAAQQCLDCHSVNRGELLGAFSYELRRISKPDAEDAKSKTAAAQQDR